MTKNLKNKKNDTKANRLIEEKSPYLLQHANNPVDWYPWCDEAFEAARKKNKPILLSIGYSTCHWCHVMAHESFEDSKVAELMNETFISIKVDREERPDIDGVYMAVCHAMTGSGGWPLTIFMTPDKKPIFAATYLPKEPRFGQPGIIDVIKKIKDMWTNNNPDLIASANKIAISLQQQTTQIVGDELTDVVLTLAFSELDQRFDEDEGGFGNAPKFPTPHTLLFLLRNWHRTGDENALAMVEKTLQAIRKGGIFDHIGFGVHRYSTDYKWLVPHFEKMLYDQALLAMAYTETYQATGKEEYRLSAKQIFGYVLRDMTAPEGGFYSAEDADSEGEEGKFYLWTEGEIREILGKEDADLIIKVFNIQPSGNFIDRLISKKVGTNILHLTTSMDDLASELKMPIVHLQNRVEDLRKKMFSVREARVHPHKDDKILTDWNGLMIAALAKGGRVFNKAEYTSAAERALKFILETMTMGSTEKENGLLHRYRDGDASIDGYVNDYSFLIWGLLELYETTFDDDHLECALKLNDYLLTHFWDKANGGFYVTQEADEELLFRDKEVYDGAIPSGNSIALLNMLKLARLTGNSELEERANKLIRAFSIGVKRLPSGHTQFLIGLDYALGPAYEVVIKGKHDAKGTRNMIQALNTNFIPNKVILFNPKQLPNNILIQIPDPIIKVENDKEQTKAYVCVNYSCKKPTSDVEEMLRLLGVKNQ